MSSSSPPPGSQNSHFLSVIKVNYALDVHFVLLIEVKPDLLLEVSCEEQIWAAQETRHILTNQSCQAGDTASHVITFNSMPQSSADWTGSKLLTISVIQREVMVKDSVTKGTRNKKKRRKKESNEIQICGFLWTLGVDVRKNQNGKKKLF